MQDKQSNTTLVKPTANANRMVRLKNNLFIWQDGDTIYFQRAHDEGLKAAGNEIALLMLELFQTTQSYTTMVELISNRLGVEPFYVQQLIEVMAENSFLEFYSKEHDYHSVDEKYVRQVSYLDILEPSKEYSELIERQKKIENAHILIIGVGGIGNQAALTFAAMGVGTLTLVDGDKVERSNLARQILFTEESIGKSKTHEAAVELKKRNPKLVIHEVPEYLQSASHLNEIMERFGRPNFIFLCANGHRGLPYWVDEAANELQIGFITCSYQGYSGLIGPLMYPGKKRFTHVVKPTNNKAEKAVSGIEKQNQLFRHPSSCASNAVLANLAVLETIKYITEISPVTIKNRRLIFNLKTGEMNYELHES